ncbi:MAG: leucine-rich repeat domain-containing protein [Chthoniobacterales bacterium]
MLKTAVVIVTLLAGASWASAQFFTNGPWTYTLNEANEATIKEYIVLPPETVGAVAIPAVLDGYPVKAIEGPLAVSIFPLFTETATSVAIPDSVTRIGAYAFSYCTSLTNVTIGSSVTSIGERAFQECVSLTSVTIPDSVTSIEPEAFRGCDSLTSVYFLGNAPTAANDVFPYIMPKGTVYYVAGTTGWSATFPNVFDGWPTVTLPIAPLLGSFGASEFGRGQSSVVTNPSAFGLFTQGQYNSNYTNGVNAGMGIILSNPASYNLYTSNSIMDLRMGGAMVPKSNGVASVSIQPLTTTNLMEPFTNNGVPITFEVPMPADRAFMRIQAKPE